MSSRWRAHAARSLTVVLGFAAAALLASAVFAQFGESGWVFDLFTHFRWQYLALALVVIPLALLRRAWWIAVAALIGGGAHVPAVFEPAAALVPYRPTAQPDLKLMNANIWWRSTRYGDLLGRIKVADAEVVVLQEVYGPWHSVIDSVRHLYPHIAPENWRDSGIVILSKHPIRGQRAGEFTVSAELDLRGRKVRLIAIHLPTPLSAAKWAAQSASLAEIAAEARSAGMPVLAVGDFNLTPYSPRFAHLLAESGLRRTHIGGFWPATWPTASGLKYAGPFWRGFAIDHVLASADFAIVGAYRGPDIGSDHFPIHVALRFAR